MQEFATYHCDLTLPSPAENLACDEALLDLCEEGLAAQVLRFWETSTPFVVVGYANHAAAEVNLPFCRQQGIPVLRRCSGGGTVLQGPGCLNYLLVLRINGADALASIAGANQFILQRHQQALSALFGSPVQRQGHTDLAIGGRKFSGNAQRRRKHCLLFHGSFLLDLDLELVEKTLHMPSRQPGYRANRSHSDFLMNLKTTASLLKTALVNTWDAASPLPEIPFDQIARLVRDKYSREEWNLKF